MYVLLLIWVVFIGWVFIGILITYGKSYARTNNMTWFIDKESPAINNTTGNIMRHALFWPLIIRGCTKAEGAYSGHWCRWIKYTNKV
jgi:hypothetical protein